MRFMSLRTTGVDHLALSREHHKEAIYITPHTCMSFITHKYSFLLDNKSNIFIWINIHSSVYVYIIIQLVQDIGSKFLSFADSM